MSLVNRNNIRDVIKAISQDRGVVFRGNDYITETVRSKGEYRDQYTLNVDGKNNDIIEALQASGVDAKIGNDGRSFVILRTDENNKKLEEAARKAIERNGYEIDGFEQKPQQTFTAETDYNKAYELLKQIDEIGRLNIDGARPYLIIDDDKSNSGTIVIRPDGKKEDIEYLLAKVNLASGANLKLNDDGIEIPVIPGQPATEDLTFQNLSLYTSRNPGSEAAAKEHFIQLRTEAEYDLSKANETGNPDSRSYAFSKITNVVLSKAVSKNNQAMPTLDVKDVQIFEDAPERVFIYAKSKNNYTQMGTESVAAFLAKAGLEDQIKVHHISGYSYIEFVDKSDETFYKLMKMSAKKPEELQRIFDQVSMTSSVGFTEKYLNVKVDQRRVDDLDIINQDAARVSAMQSIKQERGNILERLLSDPSDRASRGGGNSKF